MALLAMALLAQTAGQSDPLGGLGVWAGLVQLGVTGIVLGLLLTGKGLHTTGEVNALKSALAGERSTNEQLRSDALKNRADNMQLQAAMIDDVVPAMTRMNDLSSRTIDVLARRPHD